MDELALNYLYPSIQAQNWQGLNWMWVELKL